MSVSLILAGSKARVAPVDYYGSICGDNFFSTKFNFNFQNWGKYTQIKMRVKMLSPMSAIDPTSSDVNRGVPADYHPSVWGDQFLSFNSNHQFLVTDEVIRRHQKLKEEVRNMLINGCPNVSETLEMIDAIQRLGVNYHFQTEIDEILRNIMEKSNSKLCQEEDDDDLHLISLKFRLLRQHGYNISCDVFSKFKDSNSKLKDSIIDDARGMLSLYEATHVRTHGEETLDQALPFTIAHLQSMATQLSSSLSDQINHALDLPYYLSIPRLEARKYFQIYEGSASCVKILLSFAKLDFNLLQKQHQEEISEITRWWKKLDFANKLPFSRDRVVESYFFAVGMHFEPEYHLARRLLSKVAPIAILIDDIFDDYGAYEELELFSAAIERWDQSEIDELPEYMKEVYKATLDVYSEIDEIMVKQGKSYRSFYAKESMKKTVRANMTQSKWLHQKYIPTMEEYEPVGIEASGYPIMATTSLLGMGDTVTKHTFDWLFSNPKVVTASALMSRFMDDIADRQIERNTDLIASGVDCLMKQYNCRQEEAAEELKRRNTNLWKDINGELIMQPKPSCVPMHVLIKLLNFNRTIHVMYKDADYMTNVEGDAKDFVSSLLLHHVTI